MKTSWPCADELVHARRGDGHAVLVVLDLAWGCRPSRRAPPSLRCAATSPLSATAARQPTAGRRVLPSDPRRPGRQRHERPPAAARRQAPRSGRRGCPSAGDHATRLVERHPGTAPGRASSCLAAEVAAVRRRRRSRARKTRMRSLEQPGRGVHVEQHVPVAARSGRPPRPAPGAAVAHGVLARRRRAARPAAPTAQPPTGWRYCRISSTRSCVVEREDADGAGVLDDELGGPAVAAVAGVADRRPRARPTTQSSRCTGRGSRRPRGQPSRPAGRPRQARVVVADAGAARPRRSGAALGCRSHGRADQPREQRVRPGRAASVNSGCAWVPTKYGCTSRGQLDELDQRAVRRGAGEHQAGRLELVAVGVVDLVAVPVPLVDRARAPYASRDDASPRRARPGRGPAASCRPGRRSPATTSRCSAIVAITGCGRRGVELGGVGVRRARPRCGRTRSPCTAGPRQRPSVGMPCSRAYRSAPSLPSMPRTPKPPGTQIAVDVVELRARRPPGSRSRREVTQRIVDPGVVARTRRRAAPR